MISSSGYYPLDEIDSNLERIRAVAERFGKPFVFMECGCPSRHGSAHRPNDWRYGTGTSQEEQAAWYQAFLSELKAFPFIRGTSWWDWSATRLYPEAAGTDNNGYCTWGKPANKVLAEFSKKLP